MSDYTATVIKSGNSYALRIPKALKDGEGLTIGDKVNIGSISKRKKQDHKKIQEILTQLQKLEAFKEIKDPVAWQREIRKEWDRPLPGRE